MSEANVVRGSPRIVSELYMVGIEVAKSTVERYMVKRPKPASPTWRAFLANHLACLASIDFFIVPTVRNRVPYVFVVRAHLRRRILQFNVTGHPTAFSGRTVAAVRAGADGASAGAGGEREPRGDGRNHPRASRHDSTFAPTAP